MRLPPIELLAFLAPYAVLGVLTTLFLRFKGLPDPDHRHNEAKGCYEDIRRDRYNEIVSYTLVCKSRMGGKPIARGYWLFWVVAWPLVPVGIAFYWLVEGGIAINKFFSVRM